MNLRERIRIRFDLIRMARQASQDGLSAEEFENLVVDMYGDDRAWGAILAIFLQLLPLLLEWFQNR